MTDVSDDEAKAGRAAPGGASLEGGQEDGAAQAAESPDDEERVRAVIDELRRLKVEDLAVDMAVSLVTVGYQKLGLTEQTRVLRDLDGARLAIEFLRALLEVLEREGEAAKLADLRGTLATMQLNYARAVAEAPAAPQEGAEASREAPTEQTDAPHDASAPEEPPA